MVKKLLILFIFVCISCPIFSQNSNFTAFNSLNRVLYNPASANDSELNVFLLSHQRLDSTYSELPSYYTFGGTSTIRDSKNRAIGGIVDLTMHTYLRNISLRGIYSHRINFSSHDDFKHNISLGFSGGLNQYALDIQKASDYMTLSKPELNKLNEKFESNVYFNLGVGLEYKLAGLRIGGLFTNFIKEDIRDEIPLEILHNKPKIFTDLSYRFRITQKFSITPGAQFTQTVSDSTRYAGYLQTRLDVVILKGQYCMLENTESYMAMINIFANKDLSIGYAFENFTPKDGKSFSSHSLSITYKINFEDSYKTKENYDDNWVDLNGLLDEYEIDEDGDMSEEEFESISGD